MAAGIYDCTGQKINLGDRVRTERGDIIEVEGAFISTKTMFNAEKCKVVPKHTPLTNTGLAPSFEKRAALAAADDEGGGASGGGDCVVWGT